MIIGNGLLGNGFKSSGKNYDKYLIFVSGVSDSKENRISEFNRERELLIETLKTNNSLKMVYVSSILVGTVDNGYYKHKSEMEDIIKDYSNNYIIFRVPQIVGNIGNKNNLLNHIVLSIKNDEPITIYGDVERALIHVSDLVNIINYCLDKTYNTTVFISHIEKIKVIDLCLLVKNFLKKDVTLHVKNVETPEWVFNNSKLVNNALKFLKINRKKYNKKTIKKVINESYNTNVCI